MLEKREHAAESDVGNSTRQQEDEVMQCTRLVGPTTIGFFNKIEHVYLFKEIF